MKKRAFINFYDISVILFFALIAAALCLFAAPRGKTVPVTFTAVFTDGGELSAGDVITVPGGGVIGTVELCGDGYAVLSTGAELRAGTYYSGCVPVKHGEKYELLCGAKRITAVIRDITEAEK